MPNSVESVAKRIVAREDHLEILENAIALIESGANWIGSTRSEPPISTRTIAIGATLLVGLFIPPLFPLDEIIGTASAFRGPAVEFHTMELITPVVHPRQPLVIKTHFKYLKVCNWNWVFEWKTAAGKPIAMNWHWGSAHVTGEVGEHEMPIELPERIQPGNYLFIESATGTCDHSEVGQVPPEQVTFTVTN